MKRKQLPPMSEDARTCYAALRSRDSRFDGRFFVGVSSTGVYCRPICRVKTPKEENCSYYASAAAAEAAGFRPCLKCRPELAPGNSLMDATSRLARQAAMFIEEGGPAEMSIAELARALHVTDRHLRRAFAAEYGVSPVRYRQTCKLLLAKSLLTDSSLSITDVALTAGFGSIRRFNDLFRIQYRLAPRDLRKQARQAAREPGRDCVRLRLGYRPPYAWDNLLSFLADRAIPGIESVEGGAYRRTVSLTTGDRLCRGWMEVRNEPSRNALAVTLSPSLLPVLSKVLARVRFLFDVNCNPLVVHEGLSAMNAFSPGMVQPGLRLPGSFDPFEMSVRAILGQQVTVKAARTLAMRFAAAFGQSVETPFPELARSFPSPADIARLEPPIEDRLGPLGITGARARSIRALAEALSQGHIELTPQADPKEEMRKLLEIPGFGPWTMHYIAMRALAWPDAFPHTDYGVKKALEGLSQKEILALSEEWRPWRSYATIALWESLSPKQPGHTQEHKQ